MKLPNPFRRIRKQEQPTHEYIQREQITPQVQQPSEPLKEKKERKKRSDAGQHLITTRDRKAFKWIGEMMIIRLDHLAILLWRYSHRRDLQRYDGTLALKSAKEVVEKWKSRGFADSKKYFADEEEYVWLTLEGQRVAGIPYRKKFNEKRGLLAHYTAVNRIRLYVERKFGDEVEWISERWLRYEHKGGHIPDGVVVYREQRAAIEAELSTKNKKTSLEDMRRLAQDYDNIWFFPEEAERRRVERTIKKLSSDEQQSFIIYDTKEVS